MAPRQQPKVKPLLLDDLIERLTALRGMAPIDRAKAIKAVGGGDLAAVARATVAAEGDAAVWQAHREGLSYKEIVAELGYADDGPVGLAITNHNKRRRGEA